MEEKKILFKCNHAALLPSCGCFKDHLVLFSLPFHQLRLFFSPDVRRPNKKKWMDSNLVSKSQEGQEDEEEGVKRIRAGLRVKRERRQGSSSATMCQVCNMRLNSSAQAQIHYRGKTHQRRLRRLAKAVSAGRDPSLIDYCVNVMKHSHY